MDNKGIHLTCSDGTVFSLQFGAGNYCDNRELDIVEQYNKKPNMESTNCEVAVIDKNGEWITSDFFDESDGQVVGYISIEEALKKVVKYEESLFVLKYIKED